MLGLFDSLKAFKKLPSVITDNQAFRLHYRFTCLLLLGCTILGTTQQFGKNIECINNDDFFKAALETFCWAHSTFSIPSAWNKSVGEEVPYPGVDRHRNGEDKVYHKYYQWVYIVLLIQAIFFYTPRYLWKMFECNRIKNLILDLNVPIIKEEIKNNKALLVEYLRTHMGHHKIYITYHALLEVSNFVNVIGQMFLINRFLGGEFTRFGTKVLEFTETDQEFRADPMVQVFPRMAKCTIHRFGPSGDLQRYDAFCLLPLNILNEKIYIFLWFWFVILALVSGLAIVYRMLTIFSSRLRLGLLRFRARLTDPEDVERILEEADAGDWFVMYLLSKNLDPMHFRDVMQNFAKELNDEKPLLSSGK